MKPAQLWKAALLSACLFASLFSYSQSSVTYFEVSQRPNADSTSATVTFTLAISQLGASDTLRLALAAADGSELFNAANTIAGWKSQYPYRAEEGMLYLSVETPGYTGLSAPNATAALKPQGGEDLVYTKP